MLNNENDRCDMKSVTLFLKSNLLFPIPMRASIINHSANALTTVLSNPKSVPDHINIYTLVMDAASPIIKEKNRYFFNFSIMPPYDRT